MWARMLSVQPSTESSSRHPQNLVIAFCFPMMRGRWLHVPRLFGLYLSSLNRQRVWPGNSHSCPCGRGPLSTLSLSHTHVFASLPQIFLQQNKLLVINSYTIRCSQTNNFLPYKLPLFNLHLPFSPHKGGTDLITNSQKPWISVAVRIRSTFSPHSPLLVEPSLRTGSFCLGNAEWPSQPKPGQGHSACLKRQAVLPANGQSGHRAF